MDELDPCDTFVPMDDEQNIDVCDTCSWHRLDHHQPRTFGN